MNQQIIKELPTRNVYYIFSGTDVVRKQKETHLEIVLGAFLGDSYSDITGDCLTYSWLL